MERILLFIRYAVSSVEDTRTNFENEKTCMGKRKTLFLPFRNRKSYSDLKLHYIFLKCLFLKISKI